MEMMKANVKPVDTQATPAPNSIADQVSEM
jgi:hypothetical protein